MNRTEKTPEVREAEGAMIAAVERWAGLAGLRFGGLTFKIQRGKTFDVKVESGHRRKGDGVDCPLPVFPD